MADWRIGRGSWDRMITLLEYIRQQLIDNCESADDTWPWGKERFAELQEVEAQDEEVQKKAKAAWLALKSLEQYERIDELLLQAGREALREIEAHAPYIPRWARTEKKLNLRIQRARTKALKAGAHFVAALRAYERTIPELYTRLSRPPVPPKDEDIYEDADGWVVDSSEEPGWEEKAEKRKQWPQQIAKCRQQAGLVLRKLKAIEDHFPAPLKQPGPRAGRQAKQARNVAIREIDAIFRTCVPSHRQALLHTHALLYAAGIWSDASPQGLTGKASNLRSPSTF